MFSFGSTQLTGENEHYRIHCSFGEGGGEGEGHDPNWADFNNA